MISDSSPLILFARAGRLSQLEGTVGSIEIARQVEMETVERASGRQDARIISDAIDAGWITVLEVAQERYTRMGERHPNLGPGEQATIGLALEEDADAILLDDAAARRAAELEGVQPVGCLGVLARAYQRGTLADKPALAQAVRDLLEAGLWVSADVIEAFWTGLDGRA